MRVLLAKDLKPDSGRGLDDCNLVPELLQCGCNRAIGVVFRLRDLPVNLIDNMNRHAEQGQHIETRDPVQRYDRAGVGHDNGDIDELFVLLCHEQS